MVNNNIIMNPGGSRRTGWIIKPFKRRNLVASGMNCLVRVIDDSVRFC